MIIPKQVSGIARSNFVKLSNVAIGVVPSLMIRVGNSGNQASDKCYEELVDCYLDCSDKYPGDSGLDELNREGCTDGCDAAYNVCKWLEDSGVIAFLSPTTFPTKNLSLFR